MTKEYLCKKRLPDSPGVYLFKRGRTILYIGKATSLRDRVRSYFASDIAKARGPLIPEMLARANRLAVIRTDSVLEALLLEAELIKKHQPLYNIKEKDDRSHNCVVITDEDFPRVLLIRKKDLHVKNQESRLRLLASGGQARFKIQEWYGPFPHGAQLKEALAIIRKIFPWRDAKCTPCADQRTPYVQHPYKLKNVRMCAPCFNRQIGLCPGVCTGEISRREYARTIRHLRLLLGGKTGALLGTLSRGMRQAAREERFEDADRLKRQIFALTHIRDVALLKREKPAHAGARPFRIEGYDIAHTHGEHTVGVMVVIERGQAKKSDYRMFAVRGAKRSDDLGALREVLSRRLRHPEWPRADCIVVDGNELQRRAALSALREARVSGIPVAAVTKDERHAPQAVIGEPGTIQAHRDEILFANGEAHRFALSFHRRRRRRALGIG